MGMFSAYGDRIAAIVLGACLLVAYLLVNPFELCLVLPPNDDSLRRSHGYLPSD